MLAVTVQVTLDLEHRCYALRTKLPEVFHVSNNCSVMIINGQLLNPLNFWFCVAPIQLLIKSVFIKSVLQCHY